MGKNIGSCVKINFYIILNSFWSRVKLNLVQKSDKYQIIGSIFNTFIFSNGLFNSHQSYALIHKSITLFISSFFFISSTPFFYSFVSLIVINFYISKLNRKEEVCFGNLSWKKIVQGLSSESMRLTFLSLFHFFV